MLDAEVVKADGSVVWASTEPDLLWALRGGGSGFCGKARAQDLLLLYETVTHMRIKTSGYKVRFSRLSVSSSDMDWAHSHPYQRAAGASKGTFCLHVDYRGRQAIDVSLRDEETHVEQNRRY